MVSFYWIERLAAKYTYHKADASPQLSLKQALLEEGFSTAELRHANAVTVRRCVLNEITKHPLDGGSVAVRIAVDCELARIVAECPAEPAGGEICINLSLPDPAAVAAARACELSLSRGF